MKTKVGLWHKPDRKLPWIVYWWGDPDPDTGKQVRRYKSFKHNRPARGYQTEKQTEIDRGEGIPKQEGVTLGRLLEEYWKSRVACLSYKSHTGYRATFDALLEHFGHDVELRQITQQRAEAFIGNMKRKDGKNTPLSSWTRTQRITHCRAALDAAIEWGYNLARNPFRTKQRGSTPLRVTPKSGSWHHLIPDEFTAMMSVVSRTDRRAAYWLMYGCGLRPGEAYNVRLDGIDLDNRVVHIRNRKATDDVPPFTIKSDERLGESKARSVSIPLAALPCLAKACAEAFRSGGFVSLTPERFRVVQHNWRLCREGRVQDGRKTHREWQNADMVNNLLRDTKGYLKRAKVELSAPFTLTTFRKSFGQNHADAGTPPKALAEIMGHSDPKLTMKYYARATDANKRAAAMTMDRLLETPADRAAGVV